MNNKNVTILKGLGWTILSSFHWIYTSIFTYIGSYILVTSVAYWDWSSIDFFFMLLVMKRLNTLHKIVSLNLVIIIVYQKNIGKKCCFGCEKEQKEKKK